MKKHQNNFSNDKAGASGGALLTIKADEKQPLSKEQAAFNRLTARIHQLQEKLKRDEARLAGLDMLYNDTVHPQVVKTMHKKAQLALLADKRRTEQKLPADLNDDLDEFILELCHEAITALGPDEALLALQAKYMYGDEEAGDHEAIVNGLANEFAEQVYQQTGVRINPEHLKDGQIDYEQLKQEFEEQMGGRKAGRKARKPTAAQQAKAEKEQQKEALKQKSLRSVYVSLVKILHPDTEQDPLIKAEKEECMKKVTAAYEEKNLMELLRLEIAWVTNHEQALQSASGDMLNTYIELLKDQVRELQQAGDMLLYNPRYAHLRDYMRVEMKTATREMTAIKLELEAEEMEFATAIATLEKAVKPRKALEQCLDELFMLDDELLWEEEAARMMQRMYGNFDGGKRTPW